MLALEIVLLLAHRKYRHMSEATIAMITKFGAVRSDLLFREGRDVRAGGARTPAAPPAPARSKASGTGAGDGRSRRAGTTAGTALLRALTSREQALRGADGAQERWPGRRAVRPRVGGPGPQRPGGPGVRRTPGPDAAPERRRHGGRDAARRGRLRAEHQPDHRAPEDGGGLRGRPDPVRGDLHGVERRALHARRVLRLIPVRGNRPPATSPHRALPISVELWIQ